VITNYDIHLALPANAKRIAEMSRDFIEDGLAWRWTPQRILACIRDPETNVAVAREGPRVVGFGIMQYKQEEAHLTLLAVQASHRRRRIGTAIMAWLEATALTAGIGLVYLETRSANPQARAFYRKLGYKEIQLVRGYYQGVEDSVRIGKDLWAGV